MSHRAKVTSIEALDAFRAALVLYVNKARPALEEVSSEVQRTRVWLEDEARLRWENEIRKRSRELEQAQQSLFSARISKLRDESTLEVMAVHRARRALDEARDKLRLVKQWTRDYETRVQPLVKQLEQFHSVLGVDLPKAVAHLNEVAKTLEAYTAVRAPASPAPAAATTDRAAEPIQPEEEQPAA
jgi:hypothetical protein